MNNAARKGFEEYLSVVAKSNGAGSVKNQSVTYAPSSQQKLFGAMGESADFLKQVNHIPVEAQVGQKIGLGIGRPIASRTNTDLKERQTQYAGDLKGDEYHCKQTNFDTHIPYRLMDSWAHAGNFGRTYANQVVKQISRDVLMVGWNGESAAAVTNLEENPKLQDVNEGWPTKVVKNEPKRVMGYDEEGEATEDTWKVGEGGDYATLDALVFDLIISRMDEWHQGADDLVVMVGREILVSHGLSLLSNSTMPTERNALQTWFAAQTVAGLPCVMPPFFPSRGVVVTSYENLSIYHQMGTFRRAVIDAPKRDRVEEYASENQAFVVEDFGKYAGVRDGAILLLNHKGEWE